MRLNLSDNTYIGTNQLTNQGLIKWPVRVSVSLSRNISPVPNNGSGIFKSSDLI